MRNVQHIGIYILFSFLLVLDINVLKAQTDSLQQTAAAADHDVPGDSVVPHPKETPDFKGRQQWVGYGSIGIYAGMLYTLNKAWYSGYARSGFHFYNDDGEWNQMDKAGHAWTAYQLTRGSYAAWKWAGAKDHKALLYAGLSGPGFLTVIEILDGFSSEWGFSPGDMAANVLGSGIFLGQQALWKEQRIAYKFSFHRKDYNDDILEARADDLFGKSWNERMLKDYNAQSYWLSANLKSFFPESNLPAWLNVAVGYGAENMLGGYENTWTDEQGHTYNRTDLKRTRQFYLAPDIDLTRIKTKSKFLKTAFFALNCFKIPAPALMVDTKGKVKGYFFYF
ncbi:MAG: DUF2279 domain-containing protein [Niabella sp.]